MIASKEIQNSEFKFCKSILFLYSIVKLLKTRNGDYYEITYKIYINFKHKRN